jgi:hypothetical protein
MSGSKELVPQFPERPKEKALSPGVIFRPGYGHEAAKLKPGQIFDGTAQLCHVIRHNPAMSRVTVDTNLHAYVQFGQPVRPLLAEAPGDPVRAYGLNPAEIPGDLPGLVGLDPADEMPLDRRVALRHLVQRFLHVIFSHCPQAGTYSLVNCVNAMALADRQN